MIDIFTYHSALMAELYRLIDYYDGASINEIDLTERLEADGIAKGLRIALNAATDFYVKGRASNGYRSE